MHNPLRLLLTLLLGAGLLALLPAGAAPSTPKSDDEAVERLPYRADAATRALQARVARGALALPQALQAARQAIERARRDGDPRQLGLAQAALAPWWSQGDAPPAVRLLRATVRQAQHDFDAARDELAPLTVADDRTPLAVQAQALLTLSALQQVTGRLDAARTACDALAAPRFAPLGPGVARTARVCAAELDSLQGRADEAAATLAALAQGLPPDAGWLALVRAELADRQDDPDAGRLYRLALQAEPGVYVRAAYADWLLRHDQAPAVLALLPAASAQADALALRRAIALRVLGSSDAADAARTLRLRWAEARLRDDTSHAREEARFLLDVQGDAAAALPLAQANWARQKEPADTLLLARCAHAAGRPDVLQALRAHVRRHGGSDRRLAAVDAGRPS